MSSTLEVQEEGTKWLLWLHYHDCGCYHFQLSAFMKFRFTGLQALPLTLHLLPAVLAFMLLLLPAGHQRGAGDTDSNTAHCMHT